MFGTILRTSAAILVLATAMPVGGAVDRAPIPDLPPKYPVRIEKSAMIPMRDGVRLSTDLYFPVGAGERLPTILLRTPYGKTGFSGRMERYSTMFASQGYVVAVRGVHVGLHFEHHAGKGGVFGLHFFNHGLFVDHE